MRRLTNPTAIVALLCAAYTMSFFHRVCPSVLAPDLMKDLALDPASFSIIGSATMLGYALTQIPSGIIADLAGGRRTLAAYQTASGLLCIAFTLCGSLLPATACRFAIGLVLAGNVPAYRILAAHATPERYAQYSALLTGCGTLGSLLAATPLVALTGLAGWRAALMAAGIATMLLGAAAWLLLDDSDLKGRSPQTSSAASFRSLRYALRSVAHTPNFWFVFVWFMFAVGNMFTLLATWWGSFLMQAGGLTFEEAGLSMSIMSLGPLPFIIICPWLSNRVFRSRRIFLIVSAMLETATFGWICLHGDAPYTITELTAAGLAVGIAVIGLGSFSFTMVKESVPREALGSACGFLNCSAPVVSAALQALFGCIVAGMTASGSSAQAAYSTAFLLLLGTAATALAASLLMKDTYGME